MQRQCVVVLAAFLLFAGAHADAAEINGPLNRAIVLVECLDDSTWVAGWAR